MHNDVKIEMKMPMHYGTSHLGIDVKKNINFGVSVGRRLSGARVRKGLSQRQLAERVGIQQAHLSKIEQGKVDARLSSLVEVARALDLELQLVPRQALPAIEGAVRAVEEAATDVAESRMLATLTRHEQDLERARVAFPDVDGIRALGRAISDLKLQPLDPETIKAIQRAIPNLQRVTQNLGPGVNMSELDAAIEKSTRSLRALRDVRLNNLRIAAPGDEPRAADGEGVAELEIQSVQQGLLHDGPR